MLIKLHARIIAKLKEAEMDILLRLLAIFFGLFLGAIIVAVTGVNPSVAYLAFFRGIFGSLLNISEVVARTVPLLIAGLGIAISFRGKIFNIGGEGQIMMGALTATWIGLTFAGLTPLILHPLIFLSSFLMGALWGGICAIFKTKFGASELITTIMMNYIAFLFLDYLITGPLRDPLAGGFPISESLPPSVLYPVIVPGTRIHAGLFIAISAAFLMYAILHRSTIGYEIKAVGSGPDAASYAGINASRIRIIAMCVSGGLCALVGMIEVLGNFHVLFGNITSGFGWTAISVSILGKNDPIGVVASSILFAALRIGCEAMSTMVGVPTYIGSIIEGVIILFVLSSEWLKLRWFK